MAFQFLTIPTLDEVPGPIANVALGSQNIVSLADPVNPQDADTLNARNNAIAALGQTNNSQILTGCGVVWTGNLNFTVAAGTYTINGTTYSVSQTNLTLSAADPTNPRFDVIALNTSSAAVVITGTPAANPLVPTVDPSTQLLDTIISVPAGATQPGNITNLVQYAEDAGAPTEWNATTNSAGTINLASTNNPHTGTKCIEGTAVVSGNYIQLQQGSGTVNLSNYNNLVFYIRSKASWPSQKSFTISFLNAGTQQGNALTFQNGSFGFVSSNTTSYQQMVIPLSNFNIGNSPVNQLKFLTAGGGSSIGFYMDDVSLQAGVVIGSQAFMVWKQPWNSTTAYIANNVVTDGRGLWLCLLPNTNSEPYEGNSNWQYLSSDVPIARPDYGSVSIPDGGILRQPDNLTLSASETLSVSGSGQLIVDDTLHNFPRRGSFKPGSFTMGAGEWLSQYDHLTIDGNQSITMNADSQLILNDYPISRYVDSSLNIYQALGGTIVAESIPLAGVTGNTALGTGFVNFAAVWLAWPRTLNGVKWQQVTKGSVTSNNNNKVGLYIYSYGYLVQVAASVNNANLWQTAASDSFGNQNFSAPYVATAGLYYIAFISNWSAATTAPAIGIGTATSTTNLNQVDFATGVRLQGNISAQTDLPATISIGTLSGNNVRLYVALY